MQKKRLFLHQWIIGFLWLLNAQIIGTSVYVHFFLNAPFEESKTISIQKNSSIKTIGTLLEKEGIFSFSLILRIYWVLFPYSLKPGDYFFYEGTTPVQALIDIKEGRNIKYYISFPEGLTVKDILYKLSGETTLTGSIEKIPSEGTLLPQTYQFFKGNDRQTIIQRMQTAMYQRLEYYWAIFPYKKIVQTKQDFLTLASIVEKETAIDAERPLIARVFLNRLKKGMRLQADPTVAYGVRLSQENNDTLLPTTVIVYKKHILMDSPYNTYKKAGLPPGPICCPGELSLKAVAEPAENNFIFFVADGKGGHRFTKIFHEHQRNHAFWRRLKQKFFKLNPKTLKCVNKN